jgi:hypothetical protein
MADPLDLQGNITGDLEFGLDKSERRGERIAIQNATFTPLAPASLMLAIAR